MITIEASNIYFRGGFVLLEQIAEYCEQNAIKTKVYIGYQDVYDFLNAKEYQNIELIKTNGLKTLLRYCKKRSNILFFCNLPPFVKCEASVLYIHNPFIIQPPTQISGLSMLLIVKQFSYFYWIKFFSRNVNKIACQTNAVKELLWNNLNLKSDLFPFYRFATPLKIEKTNDFCYVGSGAPHKNNIRLLEAVDELSERFHFKIVLTIEDNVYNSDLIDVINRINQKRGRLVVDNKGLVSYDEIVKIYSSSKAMIFPSLAETLGLPLIEGIEYGLKVLSSDLPFSFQVVENPIVFNPESVEEIRVTMEKQLQGKYDDIVQRNKVPNKLVELIQHLLP